MLSRLLDFRMSYSGFHALDADHINRLPTELLGMVFTHLPLSDRIRVALVCKAWRTIALDHAELWCDLDKVNMRVLPDLLARTKQAAVRLVVHALPTDPMFPFPSRHIAPHISHIVSLDLHFPYHTKPWVASTLEYLLTQPAYILDTLSIRLERFKLCVGFPLFGGVAPRLQTLRLENLDLARRSTSPATAQVTAFRGPASHLTARGSVCAAYTTDWPRVFPSLRELHLSRLTETRILCDPAYGFPTRLSTLVLEFTAGAQPAIFDEAFQLLELANFTALRELTLVNAHPMLFARVLRHVHNAVSLALLGGAPESDAAHVRLTTRSGAALNFLSVRPRRSMDEPLLQHADIFSELHSLRIDDGTPRAFRVGTLAHICLWAPRLATLTLSLQGDRTALPNAAQGVLNRGLWGTCVLSLRNLQFLRLEGSGTGEGGARVLTDDVAHFVDGVLKLSSTSLTCRLAILGVEVVDVRRECGISSRHLGHLLQSWFAEVVYRPQLLGARAYAQRADEFLPAQYLA